MASQAEIVARSITGPDEQVQVQALAVVAGALAKAGQHEQAETMARSITDRSWHAEALAAVAGARAKADQHKQAETIARSITNPYEQAEALAVVAGALAKAGQHEQAETMARSITDPHRQAQALVAVAKALMAWGDRRQARLVASAACAIGYWTTVLEVVLSLEPSALRVVADLRLQTMTIWPRSRCIFSMNACAG